MGYFPRFLVNLYGGIRAAMRPARARSSVGWETTHPDAGAAMDPLYQWFSKQLELGYDRTTKYAEYDAMDKASVACSTALSYYADDAAQFCREVGRTVWVEADDARIAEVCNELLDVRLDIEDRIWGIARSTGKNGDDIWRVHYDRPEASGYGSRGITGWSPVHAARVRRLELPNGELVGWKMDNFAATSVHQTAFKDLKNDPNRFYNPWDFVHFRIYGDSSTEAGSMYGVSMLSHARPVWKRLKMLEESLAIYRIVRAPSRLIFYVETDDMSYESAAAAIRQWKMMHKRSQYLNPTTQEFQQYWNAQGLVDDIFWPTKKDSNSRVEQLQGSPDVNNIADLEYFRDQLHLALMIPKEYLSGEGTAVIQLGGGQSLAQKDIRYARTVGRLQRALIRGLTRICQIHLALLDLDPSAERFKVRMSTISNLDELQKIDLFGAKVNVATQFSALAQSLFIHPDMAREFALKEVLGLSGENFEKLMVPAPPPPEEMAPASSSKKKTTEDLISEIRSLLHEGTSGLQRLETLVLTAPPMLKSPSGNGADGDLPTSQTLSLPLPEEALEVISNASPP